MGRVAGNRRRSSCRRGRGSRCGLGWRSSGRWRRFRLRGRSTGRRNGGRRSTRYGSRGFSRRGTYARQRTHRSPQPQSFPQPQLEQKQRGVPSIPEAERPQGTAGWATAGRRPLFPLCHLCQLRLVRPQQPQPELHPPACSTREPGLPAPAPFEDSAARCNQCDCAALCQTMEPQCSPRPRCTRMRDVLQVKIGEPDLQLGPRVINACLSRRLLAREPCQMCSRLITIPPGQLELGQTKQCIRGSR